MISVLFVPIVRTQHNTDRSTHPPTYTHTPTHKHPRVRAPYVPPCTDSTWWCRRRTDRTASSGSTHCWPPPPSWPDWWPRCRALACCTGGRPPGAASVRTDAGYCCWWWWLRGCQWSLVRSGHQPVRVYAIFDGRAFVRVCVCVFACRLLGFALFARILVHDHMLGNLRATSDDWSGWHNPVTWTRWGPADPVVVESENLACVVGLCFVCDPN